MEKNAPNPNTLKQPRPTREPETENERKSGGRDEVGGADPAETDTERGERTP